MEAHNRDTPPAEQALATCWLPPQTTSAPKARAAARAALAGWSADMVQTVELLVCEIVTNAIVHAQTPCVLRFSKPRTGAVRIELSDEAVTRTELAPAEPTTDSGRGLVLVDALADAWGTIAAPAGKTIWLEVEG